MTYTLSYLGPGHTRTASGVSRSFLEATP